MAKAEQRLALEGGHKDAPELRVQILKSALFSRVNLGRYTRPLAFENFGSSLYRESVYSRYTTALTFENLSEYSLWRVCLQQTG